MWLALQLMASDFKKGNYTRFGNTKKGHIFDVSQNSLNVERILSY